MRSKGRDVNVQVELLVADTMLSSKDETFHRHWLPALADADIIVYDGHSGLGGNLHLEALPAAFDKRKYQVIFFNGCSSYPYYNGMYFDAKGGTRNLDVVTSGLETIAYTAGPNAFTFVKPFLDGQLPSWQKILSVLEKSNGDEGTYLTGVNGDNDNRWSPKR